MKRTCGNCIHWEPSKPEPRPCKECHRGNDDESRLRKNFFPRGIECPVCRDSMRKQKGQDVFMCDFCGSEVWPLLNKVDEKNVIKDEFEKTLPCDRNAEFSKSVMHVGSKVSSSKSSKGSKKQISNKKSTTAIYRELAAQPNKNIKKNG
jgi:uncharacterized CHY-type Zn-finger protein